MRKLPRSCNKALLLFSLCLVLFGAGPARAATPNDLTKQELLGPVKTVVTMHPQLRTIHRFDRDGRLIELDLMPANEADLSHYVFTYDVSGRFVIIFDSIFLGLQI